MPCSNCAKKSIYKTIGFLIVNDKIIGKSDSNKEFCVKCCKKHINNNIVDDKLMREKARVMYLIEMI